MPNPVPNDDLFDLSGQVAIITGTSRGLGQHFARALAKAGADLILTSRHIDTLAPFEREMRSFGRRAASFELDVRDQASIHKFCADAGTAFGQIHILVNNAGCNVRKPAIEVTWDDWNLILDTNLRGSFFVAQGIARGMIQHNYGRIINVGSVTSVAGFAGLGPYGASRGGIRQLTMSLADDWGKYCITVNCLAPGWFRTDQNKIMYDDLEWVAYITDRIPVKRPGQANDLDGAVVFLASESARYVTGQTLLVDGGVSVNATRDLPNRKP
ncbi:MAG: SDR family oxidoreductase [Acidobacteria bacterium]|nr:SDR family oxidoreductase [Acidobacteriota bacterium]